MSALKKCVIPVGGFGTRMLPASKAVPKELLPIVDKPAISYVVAEAMSAGYDMLILVTNRGKNAIEDFLDTDPYLEICLNNKNKKELLNSAKGVLDKIEVCSIRQGQPLGLGHAVLKAKDLIGNEPFAVALPDDVFDYTQHNSPLEQLTNAYKKVGASCISLLETDWDEVDKYGIADLDTEKFKKGNEIVLKGLVEKPTKKSAPSNYYVPGRYVLSPEIFKALQEIPKGMGGEYQLSDAINLLCQRSKVFAVKLNSLRYDAGNFEGYLRSNIAFAWKNPSLREAIKDQINLLSKL